MFWSLCVRHVVSDLCMALFEEWIPPGMVIFMMWLIRLVEEACPPQGKQTISQCCSFLQARERWADLQPHPPGLSVISGWEKWRIFLQLRPELSSSKHTQEKIHLSKGNLVKKDDFTPPQTYTAHKSLVTLCFLLILSAIPIVTIQYEQISA